MREGPGVWELTPELVRQLTSEYPAEYDEAYFENIDQGRRGDVVALRELTKWKNSSSSGRPMDFRNHRKKDSAFEYFLRGLEGYLHQGKDKLRDDFKDRAPVWAMFWHHVLYETPIFDVNTHIAFSFFQDGKKLTNKQARIRAGVHWPLYDRYCRWFNHRLERLQKMDPSITEREVDRALFICGRSSQTIRCELNTGEIGS
jgi:hypothetical protein